MSSIEEETRALACDVANELDRLGLRISSQLHARLLSEATDRGLSLNAFVTKLLTESLPRLIPAEEFRLTRDPAHLETVLIAYPEADQSRPLRPEAGERHNG